MENVIVPVRNPSESHPIDSRGHAAYQALLPAAMALPRCEVRRINLDVMHVAIECTAAAERLRPHAAQLATLPGFTPGLLDELATAGRALMVAESEHRGARQWHIDGDDVVTRAMDLRRRFRAWARYLAGAGRINRRILRRPQGRGPAALATELLMWANVFRDLDPTADGVTFARDEACADAARLANALFDGVGDRATHDQRLATSADRRARFFRLAFDCYGRVRRAALYLPGRQFDPDALVPSLFCKHGRRSPAP